jgi:alkyl hydroperoxide reductase subunit AhpC
LVCPTELVGFEQLRSEFEACGAAILAASTDSYWVHRAWFGSDGFLADVSYPVIADMSHAFTEAFGVRLPDGAALRATFVIDPDGVVRHVTSAISALAVASRRRSTSCRRSRPASSARPAGAREVRQCSLPEVLPTG